MERLVEKMMAQRDEDGETVGSNHERWQFPVNSPLRIPRRGDLSVLTVAHVWEMKMRGKVGEYAARG
jgi:hypothetical protein